MAVSSGAFTLTINTNSSFGERTISENAALADMLHQVAAAVALGKPSAAILDRNHNNVGSYSYGTGMLSVGR
ncbi:MAG TPA: hypothetical protein VIM11_26655 [Tepidisphaeraceae bacterium]|jgi:hypothetical protein